MYEIHRMTTIFFGRAARLLACLAAAATLCCGAAGRWEGTVDAAFRYRTAEKQTVVGDVAPGSLAARAGLLANDVVVSVDGVDVTNATAEEVLAAVRGPTGSMARIAVSRGGALVEIAVERTPRARAEAKGKASGAE
jgi:C-terminal processing protease CtpA/Prc